MSSPRFKRRAFTLVELLVVIAIIGILIALLLPAVQAAREAAKRMQCTNNLKQLALAMHNYHDVYKMFPAGQLQSLARGTPNNNPDLSGSAFVNWAFSALPFMELGNVQEALVRDGPAYNYYCGTPTARNVIPTFTCPSDQNAGYTRTWGSFANYVACTGSTAFGAYGSADKLNGMFYCYSKTRFSDVYDGTSNTAMFSEILIAADMGATDYRGQMYNVWDGNCLFSTLYPPNTSVPDRCYYCTIRLSRMPCTPVGTGLDYVLSARSAHPGGVNVALVDGSVRFVSETVQLSTWNALGTRQGKELLGAF